MSFFNHDDAKTLCRVQAAACRGMDETDYPPGAAACPRHPLTFVTTKLEAVSLTFATTKLEAVYKDGSVG